MIWQKFQVTLFCTIAALLSTEISKAKGSLQVRQPSKQSFKPEKTGESDSLTSNKDVDGVGKLRAWVVRMKETQQSTKQSWSPSKHRHMKKEVPAEQPHGESSQTCTEESAHLGACQNCLYTDAHHMETNRRRSQKSACSFWTMTSMGLWRHGGIAHRNAVLPWISKGCLVRIGCQGEEVSCLLCERTAGVCGFLPWDSSGDGKIAHRLRLTGRPAWVLLQWYILLCATEHTVVVYCMQQYMLWTSYVGRSR